MDTPKITPLLLDLWSKFSHRRKKQFIGVLILMVATSFAELISISAIFPFLAALMNPASLLKIEQLRWLFEFLEINNYDQILLPLTLIFIASASLACIMRLIQLKATLKLSFAAGADIGYKIYENTLYQPYSTHLLRNTSEVIDGITIKTSVITDGIIMSCLYITSSLIMLALFMVSLLLIAPFESIAAFSIFGSFYFFVITFSKKKQSFNSKIIAKESVNVMKSLQEGLGGIRDVLIDGTQNIYCELYRKSDTKLRNAFASSSFIASSPRFIIEALGIIILALIAYVFSNSSNGISTIIPLIGAIALAAQRLLPIMQLSYGGLSNIRRNHHTLADALDLLNSKSYPINNNIDVKPLEFNNSIEMKSISFQFEKSNRFILKNISVKVKKGSKIGIIGSSGSGKSTLLDILMGLLPPSLGKVCIDGLPINSSNLRAWQKNLAHVPQHIFLTDASIAENIAFGIPKDNININKLREAISAAQLTETVENLQDGLETNVGERGIKLSGGQRQRIGIARALYKNSSVLILDEATSALDAETENLVMNGINNLNSETTIFIVAHRLSTLKNCDRIISLENGKLAGIFSYSEILVTRSS